MDVYKENEFGIIHKTKVDFSLRESLKNSLNTKEIHVVQFDKSLPVVKVELFNNNEPYILPRNAIVKIRVGKPDKTFVYKEVLGTNEELTAIYFDVDEQMTTIAGVLEPVLEIRLSKPNGEVVYGASSSLRLVVDRNPVQESDVESETNYPLIYEILGEIDGFGQRLENLEDQAVLSANLRSEILPEDYQLNTLIISKDNKMIYKVVEGESSNPETDYVDINDQGYEDKEIVSEIETDHGVIIKFNKSAAQTAPTYYVNGTAVRVYNGNTMVFSSTELVITKIIFGFTYGSTPPTCDVGEIEDNVWTGSAREITFIFTSQRRMDEIEVEYSTPAHQLEEFADLNSHENSKAFTPTNLQISFDPDRLNIVLSAEDCADIVVNKYNNILLYTSQWLMIDLNLVKQSEAVIQGTPLVGYFGQIDVEGIAYYVSIAMTQNGIFDCVISKISNTSNFNTITIGNTTLTEQQLIQLLALLE